MVLEFWVFGCWKGSRVVGVVGETKQMRTFLISFLNLKLLKKNEANGNLLEVWEVRKSDLS